MVTISLCMIVKNEEDCLARCLESISPAVDEIIIIDTGSTDNTVEIAKKYTDNVYNFDWIDDFSAARNFSFSKATMDYCMWLDADDVILKDDLEQLISFKSSLTKDTDIVMMRYNTAFDESGNPSFVYYRERLIRNSNKYFWEGEIHEAIVPSGKIIHSEIAVTHKKEKVSDPDRNLRIFEKMISRQKVFSPREKFYYGRELFYHENYEKAISVLCDFLISKDAWIENKIDACLILCDCYLAVKKTDAAFSALARSLTFGSPRAEICCKAGELMLDAVLYPEAIYWFELALSIPIKAESGAFVLPECYGFVPCIWLCVCYDRMGQYQTAFEYNERAFSYKPTSKACIVNREYFKSRGL